MTTSWQDVRYGFRTLVRRPGCTAVALLSLILGGGVAALSATAAPRITPPASLFEDYERQIPRRMQQEQVPGLAVAVVDDRGILWSHGFGYTDWNRRTPVTPDTPFSIQSMSKSFTATAVLLAVQEGLVDLHAPVSTYLPDFRVHSIFEEHPEQRMTLLTLLSHTAGFTHEAPIGNNVDLPCHSFEEHVASIGDTRLKFPVGRRYAYSNLGIDLAGFILQVRSGLSFPRYVQEKLLTPLGMKDSTLDPGRIRVLPHRAVGHADFPLRLPVGWLIIPSGGVWTTAHDMAQYLRFHIGRGTLDGKQWLRDDLAELMYTAPNEAAGRANYGLGIALSSKHGARRLQHGGGGFGFNSYMVWYPELKIGAVVLTNKVHRRLNAELADEILDQIIAGEPNVYAQRAGTAHAVSAASDPAPDEAVLSDAALQGLIAAHGLAADEAARQRRKEYAGRYVATCMGFPSNVMEIEERGGQLVHDSKPVVEVKPGLFFDSQGEVLDLRGPSLSFRNMPLFKTNGRMLPRRIALGIVCGPIFLSALLLGPARLLRRRVGRVPQARHTVAEEALRVATCLAALAALSSLIVLVLLAAIPGLVHIPWPVPYPELQWWVTLLLDLPYAGVALAVGTGLLVAWAWKTQTGLRAVHIYYVVVMAALLIFNLGILM